MAVRALRRRWAPTENGILWRQHASVEGPTAREGLRRCRCAGDFTSHLPPWRRPPREPRGRTGAAFVSTVKSAGRGPWCRTTVLQRDAARPDVHLACARLQALTTGPVRHLRRRHGPRRRRRPEVPSPATAARPGPRVPRATLRDPCKAGGGPRACSALRSGFPSRGQGLVGAISWSRLAVICWTTGLRRDDLSNAFQAGVARPASTPVGRPAGLGL